MSESELPCSKAHSLHDGRIRVGNGPGYSTFARPRCEMTQTVSGLGPNMGHPLLSAQHQLGDGL